MTEIIDRWNSEASILMDDMDPPVQVPGNRRIIFPKNGTRVDPQDPIDDTYDRSLLFGTTYVFRLSLQNFLGSRASVEHTMTAYDGVGPHVTAVSGFSVAQPDLEEPISVGVVATVPTECLPLVTGDAPVITVAWEHEESVLGVEPLKT